jgi:hypothetical protein
MDIATTRFDAWRSTRNESFVLPGLLGFPCSISARADQTGEENYFFRFSRWTSIPGVCGDRSLPSSSKDYDFALKEETQQEIGLTDAGFAQVFVICNKVNDWLTGNLQGPLVINAQNRVGSQVVINDKKWTTRQPLLRLASEMPLAKSA